MSEALHVFSHVEMSPAGVVKSSVHFTKTPEGGLLVGVTSYSPGGPYNCVVDPSQIPQLIASLATFLPPEEVTPQQAAMAGCAPGSVIETDADGTPLAKEAAT